jgi:tRNA pseudouridine55 synthase
MSNHSAVLLIRKPSGVTSFSSLKPIKREIDRKVGHAGTLDRFAEGLMIVLTGSFTKLNPLFSNLDKQYRAVLSFGTETSTLDPEGPVIAEAPVPTFAMIESVLATQFMGIIAQTPPIYSAVHVDGKRAYKLARSGKDVDIPSRKVTIYDLKIIKWENPLLTIDVHCSKGTYIRSLARDIGKACGSRAHVVSLERTAIGPFSLTEASDTQDIPALYEQITSSAERINRLPGIGSLTLSETAAQKIRYGNLPSEHDIIEKTLHQKDVAAMLFDQQQHLLAVVHLDENLLPNKMYALVASECFAHD